MKITEIKELINSVKNADLESLKYENNGIKLEIINNNADNKMINVSDSTLLNNKKEEVEGENEFEEILSPLVGVFYEASSPEEKCFVMEGQKVSKGEVLCIVEAMKVMNEIVAKRDCIIKKVLVKNEDIIEHGQVLFLIE